MALSKTVRWLLLVLLLAALLLPCGLAPLVETTEARYSEIAREMLVSGNYLEPVFNGVKHFHKPPLAYWGVAAGMKIFGPNDFGARFIGIFFALLGVVYVYRLGALILQDKGKGIATAVIFATTLLFLGVARIASTEIYLTCFTVQAQFVSFTERKAVATPFSTRCSWLSASSPRDRLFSSSLSSPTSAPNCLIANTARSSRRAMCCWARWSFSPWPSPGTCW